MLVRALMPPAPLIVEPTSPMGEAVDLMRAHDIRELSVVDSGLLVGLLTDRAQVVGILSTTDLFAAAD